MKPPKCKLCGTAHYSHEEHKFEPTVICREGRDEPLKVNKLVLNTVDEVTKPPGGHALSEEGTAPGMVGPLTPAEKQKAYRERHKDRVRKMDRELKRRKRGAGSDGD